MRIIYFILFITNIFCCQAALPRILFEKDINDNFYNSLFENLDDSNIDSIEIKLINWDKSDINFSISRCTFDQTFSELYDDKNNHNLVYLKILDKESISLLSIIVNYTLIPYPKEGVVLFPNQVLDMEKNNSKEFIDPLDIRGKIVFYTPNGKIDAYLSQYSIDICNYRYSIGNTLSYFLYKLHHNR